MPYTPRETCDPWETKGLEHKPNRLTGLKKDECRVVEPLDRVQKPNVRHRVGLSFAPRADNSEYVPGRHPEFYNDVYVVAPTKEDAIETVKEHLGLREGVYEFSVLTLDD